MDKEFRETKSGRSIRRTTPVQSDWLPRLHRFANQFPELADLLEDYLRINLVIDANFVQQELQWRVKRNKPEARTRLHESVVSGVVVLFAPTHLIAEIEEHLPRIARRVGCTAEQVQSEWNSFREHIHFYTPRMLALGSKTTIVDEDDLPYIAACNDLAAHAIYSRDKHLRQMNAPVVSVLIDASLQSYARASSVQAAIMVGSAVSVRLSSKAVALVVGAVTQLYKKFRSLHPALQVAIAAALVYVFVDERLRKRFITFLKGLGRLASPILDVLLLAGSQLEITKVSLEAAREEIIAVLPAQRRMPVLARARRMCLLSEHPISLGELEQRIIADGYRTNSLNFSRYLRCVLRDSEDFTETSAGWQLR